MSDEPTVCRNCKRLYVVNKSDPYYRWLCMAAPMPQWFNPVTGETVADPPWALCKNKNRNANCEDYSPGINSLSPNQEMPK